MTWNVEDAQQQFSEVINAADQEPQLIYQHNFLVAAVIKADLFHEFLAWQQHRQQHLSLASAFTELRQICLEEDYMLEIPPRQDRPNAFDSNRL
ncbi:MAG: type II toxin-antitoxin system Phd/YefM family antitoxin [Tildeniella torsiva UHER 1998/13D]|jgi:hypothetical protein|nr:type II toxin-antitoxin system Phd/YefM family antitoxin [Tildeniella torsiva UHER 1998/13D]